jgi:hypothetical protein
MEQQLRDWWLFWLALFLCALWLLISPSAAWGAGPPLVALTEIHPQPSSGSEWVELYNPGESAIDLGNWSLWDVLSSPSLLVTFPTNTLLEPHALLQVTIPGAKLNNSGDGVVLKDPAGTVMDSLQYGQSTLGVSWHRLDLATTVLTAGSPNPGIWTGVSPSPSPSSLPTPTPTPSPSPTPVSSPSPSPTTYPPLILTELNACASETTPEWVELYNPTSDAVSLDAWSLVDATGNTHALSGEIPAQSWLVVTLTSSILNNSGDSIHLLTPTSEIISFATFGSCKSGTSFIVSDGGWVISSQPTPGAVNIVTNPNSSPTPTPSPSATVKPKSSASPSPAPVRTSSTQPTPGTTSAPRPSKSTTAPINHLPLISSVTTAPLPTPAIELFRPEPLRTTAPSPTLWGVILGGVVMISTNTAYLYVTFSTLPAVV